MVTTISNLLNNIQATVFFIAIIFIIILIFIILFMINQRHMIQKWNEKELDKYSKCEISKLKNKIEYRDRQIVQIEKRHKKEIDEKNLVINKQIGQLKRIQMILNIDYEEVKL